MSLDAKNQWETSLINYNNYINYITTVLSDDTKFNNFRNTNDPGYTAILEHVDQNMGKVYFDEIKKNVSDLENYIKIAKENDTIGSPLIYDYDAFSINPTTLRYLKYAIEIKQTFSDIKNINYVEVGAGYGGLCKILNTLCNFNSINFFDLPEALELQRKYLSNFDIFVNKLNILDDLIIQKNTLFVSNYALSELNHQTRRMYMDKVISKCKYAFIVSNNENFTKELLTEFNANLSHDCLDRCSIVTIKNLN